MKIRIHDSCGLHRKGRYVYLVEHKITSNSSTKTAARYANVIVIAAALLLMAAGTLFVVISMDEDTWSLSASHMEFSGLGMDDSNEGVSISTGRSGWQRVDITDVDGRESTIHVSNNKQDRKQNREHEVVVELLFSGSRQCRFFSVYLSRQLKNSASLIPSSIVLTIKPRTTHEAECKNSKWHAFVNNSVDTRPPVRINISSISIHFTPGKRYDYLIGGMIVDGLRTHRLISPVNPMGIYKEPGLTGKNLNVESRGMKMISLALQAEDKSGVDSRLAATLQANDYDKIILDGVDKHWGWLWDFVESGSLIGLIVFAMGVVTFIQKNKLGTWVSRPWSKN
jgi:hypothetical protein